MSKKKKRDIARETASLEKLVNTSGQGEDPAVKALLSDDFVKAPDVEALDVALALQEILRGQKLQEAEIRKLRQQMSEYDKSAQEWNYEREKFVDKMDSAYEKLTLSEEDRVRLQIQESERIKKETDMARANASMRIKSMKEKILTEPTETVVAPGELLTIREGKNFRSVIADTVIRIGQLEWKLPPGKPVDVPKSVANRLREMQLEKEEDIARRSLLDADRDTKDVEIARKWEEINEKYNSPSTDIMIASTR